MNGLGCGYGCEKQSETQACTQPVHLHHHGFEIVPVLICTSGGDLHSTECTLYVLCTSKWQFDTSVCWRVGIARYQALVGLYCLWLVCVLTMLSLAAGWADRRSHSQSQAVFTFKRTQVTCQPTVTYRRGINDWFLPQIGTTLQRLDLSKVLNFDSPVLKPDCKKRN